MRHPQQWYFPQFQCNMRKISAKRYGGRNCRNFSSLSACTEIGLVACSHGMFFSNGPARARPSDVWSHSRLKGPFWKYHLISNASLLGSWPWPVSSKSLSCESRLSGEIDKITGRLRFHDDHEYENKFFVGWHHHFLCYSWVPIRYRCSRRLNGSDESFISLCTKT